MHFLGQGEDLAKGHFTKGIGGRLNNKKIVKDVGNVEVVPY